VLGPPVSVVRVSAVTRSQYRNLTVNCELTTLWLGEDHEIHDDPSPIAQGVDPDVGFNDGECNGRCASLSARSSGIPLSAGEMERQASSVSLMKAVSTSSRSG
jgi:hypothetical protein